MLASGWHSAKAYTINFAESPRQELEGVDACATENAHAILTARLRVFGNVAVCVCCSSTHDDEMTHDGDVRQRLRISARLEPDGFVFIVLVVSETLCFMPFVVVGVFVARVCACVLFY